MKLLQNRISENRFTLPIVIAYAIAIWLVCGLIDGQRWLQFACFLVSTYLMIELNNRHALIRIYSKMVSCSYLTLTAAACFMMGSLQEAAASMFVIAAYLLLFHTYQSPNATGTVYYSYLCIGMASLFCPQLLLFVPAYWLVTGIFMQSMNIKSFGASIFGLLTPYWFALPWLIYQNDFTLLHEHLRMLTAFEEPFSLGCLTLPQWLALAFTVVLQITGCIHFINTSYNDKIRIRMIYYCFIAMSVLSLAYLLIQPQQYDMALRLLIINTSPLIGHFLALTRTRITNIAFFIIVATALIITAYNVWTLL